MNIFEMDEETFDRWRTGAIDFGRVMVKHGIDSMELVGHGVKTLPERGSLFLEGILFLGFKRAGVERLEILKYGTPVSHTEIHITHADGETILEIPDES